MNFPEWFGLILFIVALLITNGLLAYDGVRKWYWKILTISEIQWAKLQAWRAKGYKLKDFPWLVLLLPIGVGLQALGLLIHFLGGLD